MLGGRPLLGLRCHLVFLAENKNLKRQPELAIGSLLPELNEPCAHYSNPLSQRASEERVSNKSSLTEVVMETSFSSLILTDID